MRRESHLVSFAATSVSPVDFKNVKQRVPFVEETCLPYVGGRDVACWVTEVGQMSVVSPS
jgi:hypothetical protein